jgi:hypothetical protein
MMQYEVIIFCANDKMKKVESDGQEKGIKAAV